MKFIEKKAFTLAEALITLAVLGVLTAVTTPILKSILPEFDVFKVKKIHSVLKTSIDEMLYNSVEYGGLHDFSNLRGDSFGGIIIHDMSEFRNVFYSTLEVKNRIPCKTPVEEDPVDCVVTADNVVWGVPDTDFNGSNVVSLGQSSYAYIVVYPDYNPRKHGDRIQNDPEFMNNNAIFYGIRKDGKIIFLDNLVDCTNDETKRKTMHCLAQKYLVSSKNRGKNVKK